MAAFLFSEIRAAVVSQVEGQLPAVTVNDYPQPQDQNIDQNTATATFEWVQFEGFRVTREEATYGNTDGKRHDMYDLSGSIGVRHTNVSGNTPDTAWKVVEDRAQELLNGVAAAVETDPTLGGAVFHAEMGDASQTMGGDKTDYAAGFDFVVRVEVFAT